MVVRKVPDLMGHMDDCSGLVGGGGVERREYGSRRCIVEGRGGLVEKKERCILQQCAGDRDTLCLSAGQFIRAVSEIGVHPVGKRIDPFQKTCLPEHMPDLLFALPVSHGDVLIDRHRKQHR